MKETFRLRELFCGPGGIALGAKSAKVQSELIITGKDSKIFYLEKPA